MLIHKLFLCYKIKKGSGMKEDQKKYMREMRYESLHMTEEELYQIYKDDYAAFQYEQGIEKELKEELEKLKNNL